jgi:putative transcriptional regulator (Ypuh-like)
MAMVAYRQPITRAEVDEIRGVDSGGVLKTLLDRELVRIVGKKEEPGKPLLYGTTDTFLEVFGLRGLQDLPTLKDLRQIEDEMKQKSLQEGEMVSLGDEFFEETSDLSSLPDSSDPNPRTFEELEKEEEEAFSELDDKIRSLETMEQTVLGSLSEEASKKTDTSDISS